NIARADLRNSNVWDNLGNAGTTSLYAYSLQSPVNTTGPNATVNTLLRSNGVLQAAPALKTFNGASNVIRVPQGAGKPSVAYGPPIVGIQNQGKNRIVMQGDVGQIESVSGFYDGNSAQFRGVGGRFIAGQAFTNEAFDFVGPLPPGRAAGGAFDPFQVSAGPY